MNIHYNFNTRQLILYSLTVLCLSFTPAALKAQLSGSSYTIDANQAASATNYRNFQSFFNDIWNRTRTDGGPLNGPGISSAVEVNVAQNQTFNEQVTVNPHSSLNANRRVVIKGNNALLTFNANTTNRHTLWLNGADFFTFDGLQISGTNVDFVYTVRLSNQADFNIFQNCVISAPNYNYTGQTISQFVSATTATNTNIANASAIIAFTGQNNSLNNATNFVNGRGNIFTKNRLLGPTDGSTFRGPTYGIFEQGSQGSSLTGENEFTHNEIHNISGIGIYSWGSGGGKYNHNIIRRNLNAPMQPNSTSSHFYGIWLHYPYLNVHTTKDIEVIGNDMQNIGSDARRDNSRYFVGIHVSRVNGSAATNTTWTGNNIVRVERNIIANNRCGQNSTNSAYFYGLSAYYSPSVFFVNNLVVNNTVSNDMLVGYGGTLVYIYQYAMYKFYSTGDVVNNTFYDRHNLRNNAFMYNYNCYFYANGTSGTSNVANPTLANTSRLDNNIMWYDYGNDINNIYEYVYWLNISSFRNNLYYSNISRSTYSYFYRCRIGANANCTGTNPSGDININEFNNNFGSESKDNISVNPNFVDERVITLYYPTNPRLKSAGLNYNNAAYPNGVTRDVYDNTRDASSPSIGATEPFFEFSISGDFNNGVYKLCGGERRPLSVRVKSELFFNFPNPRVGYQLNNNPIVFKSGDAIGPFGSLQFTFDDEIDFTGAQDNSVLKVFIAHPDDNKSNDTLTFRIEVGRGAYGGVLTVADNTMGIPPSGDRTHWITIPDDPIRFNITSPTNYANNRHGIDYQVFPSARTINSNITLPASASTYSHNPVTGGTWTINPPEAFVDSMINVQLRIRDNNTGCDSFINRTVLVAPFGKPNFKVPSVICAGNTIEIENEATVQSGYLEYEWNFGNGVTSKQTNGRPTYMAPGTYQVTLKTTTVPYGFVKSITRNVVVNEGPIANFTYESKCFGTPVVLTNTSTELGGTPSYTWNFGNGQTATTRNASVNYTSPGLYTVTLTASRNGCVTQKIEEVAQFEQPVADFALRSGTCQNAPFVFDNLTGNVSGKVGYLWSFGETNASSTQVEGHHVYRSSGSKQVTLTVTTALGCKDQITKNINVIPGPSADFTIAGQCQNQDVRFTSVDMAMGQNPVYSWIIDGESLSTANATMSFAGVGSKQAQLSVRYANGCANTVLKTVDIQAAPIADFSSELVCAGQEAIIKNKTSWTDGSIQYTWSPESGVNRNDVHLKYIFSTPGTKSVTLKASINNGCSNEVTKQVNVSPAPTRCDFDIKAEGSNGLRYYSFIPTNGNQSGAEQGVTYTWFYGDGSSNNNGGKDYASDGAYTVTMRAETPAGCFCESTRQVIVDRLNNATVDVEDYFNVYPNPNNGTFVLSLPSNAKGSIEVSSSVGQIIAQFDAQQVVQQGGQLQLDGLSAGIYLVKYTGENKSSIRKMQVTK
jgi:PKD repeat protein